MESLIYGNAWGAYNCIPSWRKTMAWGCLGYLIISNQKSPDGIPRQSELGYDQCMDQRWSKVENRMGFHWSLSHAHLSGYMFMTQDMKTWETTQKMQEKTPLGSVDLSRDRDDFAATTRCTEVITHWPTGQKGFASRQFCASIAVQMYPGYKAINQNASPNLDLTFFAHVCDHFETDSYKFLARLLDRCCCCVGHCVLKFCWCIPIDQEWSRW